MPLERLIAQRYKHTQDTADTTWVVQHNLNRYPLVDVFTLHEGQLKKIIPLEVIYVNANLCHITFSTARDGFATVV